MNRDVDFKIVLLGDIFVGKTCLLDRFAHDRFKGENAYPPTIGAAFAARKMTAKSKNLIVGMWDTAGCEKYTAIGRMYYRGAAAAIVCFDAADRASWKRAKFWIQELRTCEEGCRLYLCCTKLDRLESGEVQREIDYDTALQYAEGIAAHYVEISSKTGKNIAQLFQKIAEDFMTHHPEKEKQVEDGIILYLHKKETRQGCCYKSSAA